MPTFGNGAGVQVRKYCERIPRLPDYRDTVVGETLPCVAESSNSSDSFAVANLANFQIRQFAKIFPSPIKPTIWYILPILLVCENHLLIKHTY